MVRDAALADELIGRVEVELFAADTLLDGVASDPELHAELDRRLAAPPGSLVMALDAWSGRPPGAEALLEANADNAAWLDSVIEQHGWPGLRLVGAHAADAAWWLAQHADRSNDRRRTWVTVLRAAVESGDADPRHLAELTDRVAAVAGEEQEYGTIRLPGEVPLREPAEVDARRAAIGLPSLSQEAASGELVPYAPERGSAPLAQWPLLLEGHVSVEAALAADVRQVHRIWAVRPGDRRLGRLRALARERGVIIEAVEAEVIDEVARGRSHGGVVGLAGPRRTLSVHQLLDEVGERSLIVMLDGIEDPFNHGQAVRSLYAAGVDGLVVRRHWETALATVTRASAGASELLPTATAGSAEEAAELARAAGMRVACAVGEPDATPIDQADLSGGLFLLIGGERRGITRSFVAGADLRVRIEYGRDGAPDLGAAAAAAIIGFEALRQRRSG